MVDMEALKAAVAELQGIINTADGRDMVARRKPSEVPPGEEEEGEVEEGEAPAVTVEVEPGPAMKDEDEEKKALSPEERRKLVGF